MNGAIYLGIYRTGIWALLILTLHSASPQLEAQSACIAKVESFANEKPILMLPNKYRDGIISAVLPDLQAAANASGYDSEDLRPAKLAHSLHYWPVSESDPNTHLWVVRFTSAQACGPHGNCPSYVISSSSRGVLNVLQGRDSSFGTSAGGAFGIAILPTGDANHPELLFLGHISGYETAVGCFVWSGGQYRFAPCTPECAHFLDTPPPR
jgi:hypothetical protein